MRLFSLIMYLVRAGYIYDRYLIFEGSGKRGLRAVVLEVGFWYERLVGRYGGTF